MSVLNRLKTYQGLFMIIIGLDLQTCVFTVTPTQPLSHTLSFMHFLKFDVGIYWFIS